MNVETRIKDIRKWFRDQPNSRLLVATIIIIATFYVLFGFNKQFDHEHINYELGLGRLICENAEKWIQADSKRLKMGQGDLRDVKVRGQKITLEHVDYPKVVFLDSGIRNIDSRQSSKDFYCVLEDPRNTSGKFFYNYEKRLWVDKVRFHR